jgi:hypothetical protein
LDVFEQLRQSFDGADSFVSGGHAVRGGGSTSHAERVASIPEWANNDTEVRSLLKTAFPKLDSSPTQRKRAAAWMLIIQYYFRMGLTHHRIVIKTGWTQNKIMMLIRNIRWAAEGKRAGTGKPRSGKRGRPKLNSDILPATYETAGS